MERPVSRLRRRHQRLVVDGLLAEEGLSRADLSQRTGLSPPTVGKVADELIRAGVIESCESSEPTGSVPVGDGAGVGSEPPVALGRPSRPLRLDRTTPRYVALQLGVRRTRLAAIPVSPRAMDCPAGKCVRGGGWSVDFRTPRRSQTWLSRLKQVAKQVRLSRPWSVLVSVPGVVNEGAARVLYSPNLHWTEQADLVELVRGVWDAPVLLCQEIRALALGHLSSEPGEPDFLLVDFGDGVGAALMQGGRLYCGSLPLSGELGHTPSPGNTRLCGCGAIGCIETLVSRPGLLASYQQRRNRRVVSRLSWRELAGDIDRGGVPAWMKQSLESAATVIGGAMNFAGVRQVVITGSLTELPAVVTEYLAGRIERAAMWARFGSVKISVAPRRRAAGLAMAAIDRLLIPSAGSADAISTERREDTVL